VPVGRPPSRGLGSSRIWELLLEDMNGYRPEEVKAAVSKVGRKTPREREIIGWLIGRLGHIQQYVAPVRAEAAAKALGTSKRTTERYMETVA
jgi:hypothetical protein